MFGKPGTPGKSGGKSGKPGTPGNKPGGGGVGDGGLRIGIVGIIEDFGEGGGWSIGSGGSPGIIDGGVGVKPGGSSVGGGGSKGFCGIGIPPMFGGASGFGNGRPPMNAGWLICSSHIAGLFFGLKAVVPAEYTVLPSILVDL
jgi:hypothetical protein